MNTLSKILISALMVGGFTFQAHAKGDKHKDKHEMVELTKEQRDKMASLHEQMANCLRSDKSAKECHEDMKQSCKSMGKEACPMMGHHDMEKTKKSE